MSSVALFSYPRRVAQLVVALRTLESTSHQTGAAATYDFLQRQLEAPSREAVVAAVRTGLREGLVERLKPTVGGRGIKAAFRLTNKGRTL